MASAEFLESRITPASATFAGGLLTISGTAGGASVLVAEGASSTNVSVNNVLLATLPGATTGTITTITFAGAGGGQTLTITGNGPVLNAINFTGGDSNLVVSANATPTGGTLTVTGGGATLNFGNTNVVGNLTVTGVTTAAGGAAVSDTGRLSVSGTLSVTVTDNTDDDIVLNTASNGFGSLVLNANDVTIVEAGNTNFGTVAGVNVVTGALGVTSTGSVTDSNTLTVTGAVSIATTDNGAITLDSAASTFGTLTLTAGKITIVEAAATDLGAVTASLGDLNVTTTVGAINDSAAISVLNGRATFTANGVGGAVILNDAGHRFKSISAVTIGNATITEADSTELYTTTVGGDFVVSSGGAITDVGSVLTLPGTQAHSTILVTGSTSLTAGGATPRIVLDSPTNNFDTNGSGDNVTFSGSNVTLVDAAGQLEFGASTATGILTVTAAGNVIDDGVMAITGKATIRTTGDITFDTSTFGSLSLFGANATITEAGGTDLLTSSLTGNLSVTTGGADITNGNTLSPVPNVPNYATLEVAGTATFNAGAGDITIQAAGPVLSSFGTLTLTGDVVTITEHNQTTLGAVSANTFTLFVRDGAQGAAPLGGGVTQVGGTTIAVTGLATIDATSKYDIDLTTGTNNFGSLIFAGLDVSITEATATVLGERSSTTSTQGNVAYGDLHLTSSGGSITQTAFTVTQRFGKLIVLGTADIESGAGTVITLDRVDPTSALSGAPTANANKFGVLELTTTGAATADVTILEAGPTNLGTTNLVGDLTLTSTGPITDSGTLTVAGATILNAGANTIILDSNDGTFNQVPTNDLQGPISLTGTNLILKNTGTVGGTVLGAITASGNLHVASTTTITNPTLAISVTGKGTFTTTAGATAADPVSLGTTARANFGSLSVVGATNLTVREGSATVLDGITITGDLNVDSTSNITDVGPVLVTGNTDLVSLGAITLDNPSNNFDVGGAPGGDNFDFSATGNVTIVDAAGGIEFDASQGLTLNVKAAGGDVTDAGTLTITNAVTITALGNDIVLDVAGNTYGTLTLQGATATIVDAGALSIGPSTIQLSNARGALTLTAGGAVTQTGAILAGATSITAGANAIALTNAGNRLGAITTVSGTNVAYTENEGVILGVTNANGTLNVIAKGAITQTGAIDAGTTTLNASTSSPITLGDGANRFGPLTMTGSNISIAEDDLASTHASGLAGTDLGATTATGTLTVAADGTVTTSGTLKVTGRATVTTTGDAVSLGSATASFGSVSVTGSAANNVTINEGNATDLFTITTTTGNLSVTSAGAITDSGLLTIGGTTTLVAGSGNAAITLNTSTTLATNDFTGLVTFDGTNVILVDANAISLDTSDAAGVTTLSVTATTAVTQGGDLDVTGATTIKTGTGAAGDITLNTAGVNTFGTLTLIGNDVDIADSAAANIGASTITGTFDLTAGGAVTQSGSINGGTTPTLASTGAVDINAGGAAITLTQTNNSFGALTLTGVGISVREADEIAVTSITGGAGSLSLVSTVATTTAISQTGAINATGNTTLTAIGTNKDIDLNTVSNTFGSLAITGGNVEIDETGGTDLAASTISGTLNILSNGGDIDDSGTVHVAGTTTLNSGAGAITLDEAASTYGTFVLTSTGGATVTDAGPVNLGDTSVSGGTGLTVIAGTSTVAAAITDSVGATITVSGGATFATGGAVGMGGALITLDSALGSYTGEIDMYGTNVVLTNTAAATNLSDVVATGTLTVTSDGDITNTAGDAISVTGIATFDANTGTADDILLNAAGATTAFGTVKLDANDVSITGELDDLDLGTSTITGDLTVTVASTGDITDSGVLTVGGTATLTAVGDTIILDQATSTFGFNAPATADFVITAGTVSIKDNGAVELGTISVTIGDFTVTSGLTGADDITDVGVTTITVTTGFTTFNAGLGDVIITNAVPGHTFGGGRVGIGASVSIIP